MDLVSGLAGLKTASELTTRIREALGSRDIKLDEVVARIIEIQGLISDGRTALIDVQEQLLEKNREIFKLEQACTKLTERLEKKLQARKHDNAIWKVLEDDTEEGPYCPNCFELTGFFIQPNRWSSDEHISIFRCAQHGTVACTFTVPTALCAALPPLKTQERTRYNMNFPRR